ncbi:MAG: YdaU family protein [Verrucomicrobia subdivision 3 bacterium]|nr:YdaU family protein [Limisphaerales bacterium]
MKLIDNPKAEQKNDDPMPSHIVNYLEDTPPGAPCLLREESPPKIDAWMPLYVGDLIADTLHLSRADFGSYVLLILLYWRRRGPLPDDDNALSAAARVPLADWPPVRKVLAPFFQIGDGVWRHKRIDKELANSISLREAKSRAGKLGNKVRWGDKSQGDASASRAEVPNSVAKDRSSPSSSSTCNSLERENERPGVEEVLAYAQSIGLAEWKARDWFQEMEGCGWLDHNHRPVVNWRAILDRVRTKWEADGRPTQPPSPKTKTKGTHAANQQTGQQRPDRNQGTYNEGKAHLYAKPKPAV